MSAESAERNSPRPVASGFIRTIEIAQGVRRLSRRSPARSPLVESSKDGDEVISDVDMFTGLDKEETAIALIHSFQPVVPYYVANSGGKDSEVAEHLTMRAEANYQSYYCVSPIDPKENYEFLRKYYPNTIWEYHAKNFWSMVVKNGLPLRQRRWCCRVIKEAGGEGRVVIVGNRRDEGANRSNQGCFEKHRTKDKFFLRPIINWSHDEVWEYMWLVTLVSSLGVGILFIGVRSRL